MATGIGAGSGEFGDRRAGSATGTLNSTVAGGGSSGMDMGSILTASNLTCAAFFVFVFDRSFDALGLTRSALAAATSSFDSLDFFGELTSSLVLFADRGLRVVMSAACLSRASFLILASSLSVLPPPALSRIDCFSGPARKGRFSSLVLWIGMFSPSSGAVNLRFDPALMGTEAVVSLACGRSCGGMVGSTFFSGEGTDG